MTDLAQLQEAVERLQRYAHARTDAAHSTDILVVLSALQEAQADVLAFCAPWAVRYANESGLPPGHLFPSHYDILERNGARMVDFTRHEPDRALSPGGADE